MKNLLFLLILMLTVTGISQNNCVQFDGTDDYMLLPVNTVPTVPEGGISIEAWIKSTDSTGIDEIIVSIEGAYAFYMNRFQADGKFLAFFDGTTSGESAVFGDSLNDGVWHHLAATNDSSVTRMYIDGKLVGEKEESYTSGYFRIDQLDKPSSVGAQYTGTNFFKGCVDEVRIWGKVLTQEEIQEFMNDTLAYAVYADSSSRLLGYWRFDEAVGDTLIKDLSVYKNDGLLMNGAAIAESFTYTDIELSADRGIPDEFVLSPNYPNPFNPSTTFYISVPFPVKSVTVAIYNSLGERIRTLYNGGIDSSLRLTWDGTDDKGRGVSSGVYFYRALIGNKSLTKKMILLR